MPKRDGYPPTYGVETKALPDIKGPLNINRDGDPGVPDNDMAEIPSGECPDPMGFLTPIRGRE